MRPTPRSHFRALAIAEAITWALLLIGMFLKYVTETDAQLGVRIFGMLHGVVFIAYCLVTVVVADRPALVAGADGRSGLVAAVPPFATLLFEVYAERRGLLGAAVALATGQPDSSAARGVLAPEHHRLALGLLVVAVAGLTAVALVVGPPVG